MFWSKNRKIENFPTTQLRGVDDYEDVLDLRGRGFFCNISNLNTIDINESTLRRIGYVTRSPNIIYIDFIKYNTVHRILSDNYLIANIKRNKAVLKKLGLGPSLSKRKRNTNNNNVRTPSTKKKKKATPLRKKVKKILSVRKSSRLLKGVKVENYLKELFRNRRLLLISRAFENLENP